MDELEQSIWEFLSAHFVGVENAAPRAAIIARYNLLHLKQLSDRKFRDVVSVLVTVHKKSICTPSDQGYYVARTSHELGSAVADLRAKGRSIFARADALEQTDPVERQERLPL